jgi:cell division protein ZapA
MTPSYEVHVQGQVFRLRTDSGEDYVQELIQYVESVMKEVMQQSRSPASDRIAIMAALQIADRFLHYKHQVEGNADRANRVVGALIYEMDRLLEL